MLTPKQEERIKYLAQRPASMITIVYAQDVGHIVQIDDVHIAYPATVEGAYHVAAEVAILWYHYTNTHLPITVIGWGLR